MAMGAEAAVVSGLLRAVSNQASSLVLTKLRLLQNGDEEVEKLKGTVSILQAFLVDAERRQHGDGSVDNWLRNLQDVAYDAEDLLDELATDAMLGRRWEGSLFRLVRCILSCFVPIPSLFTQYQMASRIKSVRERLDWIVKDGRDLGIQQVIIGRGDGEIVNRRPQRETSSLSSDFNVVGRSRETDLLVHLLLSYRPEVSESEVDLVKFFVIYVTGMGGLGKTTLARLAYNHPRLQEYFRLKMWVQVSDNFSVVRVISELIESATGCRPKLTTLDALQKELMDLLKGKRFMIVLDDVWEEHGLWDALRIPLNSGEFGSRVVITTRNQSSLLPEPDVPTTHIRLGTLSLEECWLIFQRYAFVGEKRLEMVGREIVKKARGVPMAAKALGGLVRTFGPDEHRWRSILELELSNFHEERIDIIPVLRLSYQHLPPHMKRCFSYCAIFPKGYVFDKVMLVRMWMALGFIQERGRERMEDVGSDCFDALLRGSFFQSAQGGKYVMHDFMQDLATSVSQHECFRMEAWTSAAVPQRVRYLSLSAQNPQTLDYLHKFPKLRSLVFLSKDEPASVHQLHKLFKKLKSLRLLDLNWAPESSDSTFLFNLCGIHQNNFPYSICSLKHLRYLRIAVGGRVVLPESIGDLYNVQSLNFKGCEEFCRLPVGVTNLVNLRVIEANADEELYNITGIGKLTSLQALKEFTIGAGKGPKIGELRNLRELGGKLSLLKLENVASGDEAKEARLDDKPYIDALELKWSSRSVHLIDSKLDEEVLESLRPHANLRELVIENYGGVRSPRWMQSLELPFLESIRLHGCQKWAVLPPLGQLQFLKVLEMSGMDGGGQEGSFMFEDRFCMDKLFPSLRILRIRSSLQLCTFPTLPPTLTSLSIDALGFTAEMATPRSRGMNSLTTRLKVSQWRRLVPDWQVLLQHHLWALDELTISRCPSLAFLPIKFGVLTSLRKLSINSCPMLIMLPPLPSTLEELNLWEVGLSRLPEICGSTPSSLSALEISECASLNSLCKGLFRHGLRALKHLVIDKCVVLESLPREGLKAHISLRYLDISDCPKLKEFPPLPPTLEYLGLNRVGLTALPRLDHFDGGSNLSLSSPALRKLAVTECPNLKSLTKGLLQQDLMALEVVFICNCDELARIPGLGALTSLRLLTVARCPKLSALPWDALPTSLETFELDDCPLLKEQCRGNEGYNGPKISHPQLKFRGRWYRLEPSSQAGKYSREYSGSMTRVKNPYCIRGQVTKKVFRDIFRAPTQNLQHRR